MWHFIRAICVDKPPIRINTYWIISRSIMVRVSYRVYGLGSLASQIRCPLTAQSGRTKCGAMAIMKDNGLESRIVWLTDWTGLSLDGLFRICGFPFHNFWLLSLARRSCCCWFFLFKFLPRIYNRLAKSERRGRARRCWSHRRQCNISTFVFDLPATKWKITCTPMWHTEKRQTHTKKNGMQERRKGGLYW